MFTGISLPEDVSDTLQLLRQPLPSTRWIEPQDYHITLRFAGDISPPVVRELAANLANITFDPFPVTLTGLGTFGGDDPRLLFAAVEQSEALTSLARANETAARRAGLEPTSRKFTPHVTLARFQNPRIEPIARFLSRRGSFRTAPFLVSGFNLYSAKPITGGGPYVIEQTIHSTLGDFDGSDWDDDV
jgi:2'-5' RNA ligase